MIFSRCDHARRQIMAALATIAVLFSQGQFAFAQNSLDLSSPARTNIATQRQTVTIRTGDTARVVGPSSPVTPAEMAAVHQLLSSGRQTLQLSNMGVAQGGTLHLDSALTQNASNLVVPQGVTVFQNASNLATLNLSGNFSNIGQYYLFSSGAQTTTASIIANNIFNMPGAVLSSIVPSSYGLGNIASVVNVNLHALQNIVNSGVISSSGNLSLFAGGTITNGLSVPQSGTNSAASITAVNNLNLQAASVINSGVLLAQNGVLNVAANSIANSNLIESIKGNVNLVSSSVQAGLTVDNRGGVIRALMGDINITAPDGNNVSVIGGDFLSRELNLRACGGLVDVEVGDVSGIVNTYAQDAHVGAATPSLRLGQMDVMHDPAYFNLAGDLFLTSLPSTNGAPLLLAASQDVIVTALTIDTTQSSGSGGDLTIVAGANISNLSSPGTSVLSPPGDSTSTIQISGPSATGGAIDLSAVSSIKTGGTGSNSSGGNVRLIAFNGTPAGSSYVPGTIDVGAGINTGGTGTALNGNVTVIAGAATTASIGLFGTIDTGTATGGGGAVNVQTATPTGTAQFVNGGITGGALGAGATLFGAMSVGSINTSGASGTIFLNAGDTVKILGTSLINAGGDVTVQTSTLDNSGIVASSGVLKVTASTLTNNNSMNGASIDINLTGAVGSLNNYGTIGATTGSLSIVNLTGLVDIFMGNAAATLSAGSGPGANLNLDGFQGVSVLSSPGQGLISSANKVNILGHSGDVDVQVGSVLGLVTGSGDSFKIDVDANNLKTGIINAGIGGVKLAAETANVLLQGDVSTPGDLHLKSGLGVSNRVDVAAGTLSNAFDITVDTPNLTVDGHLNALNTITVNGVGTPVGGSLNVVMSSSGILQAAGPGVYMFAGAAGGVSVTGSGSIIAPASGDAFFSGGSGDVAVTAQSIAGKLGGSGTNYSVSVNNGNLVIKNTFSASDTHLSALASTSSITVLNAVSAGPGGTVFLSAGAGGIDAATFGVLDATSVQANSTGQVNIIDTAAGLITLNPSSAGAGSSFTFDAQNIASGLVGGNLSAGSAFLSAGSGGINLNPINVNNVQANSSGDVQILNMAVGNVTVGNSSAGNLFQLIDTQSANTIVAGPIAATVVDVRSLGSISVQVDPAASTLMLRSTGAGNILQSAGVVFSESTVDLSSNGGNIGTSVNPLKTAASSLAANTAGGVFLNQAGAVTLASSSSGLRFSLTANGAVTNTGSLTAPVIDISAPALNNLNLISATNSFSLKDNGNLSASGTGTIAAPTITFTSSGGAVNASQSTLNGVVSGSAVGPFNLTAGVSNLTVLSIKSATAGVNLTSSNGILTVLSGGNVTAGADVNLNGDGGVRLGTSGGGACLVIAGTISNTVAANSTNMNDFDTSAFLTPGGIVITNNTSGDITLGSGVALVSRGKSIALLNYAGNIKLGSSNSMFAQGGNIWVNAMGDVSGAGGVNLIAVARSINGGGTLTIDGQSIPDFRGGDIGIDVDTMVAGYDAFLRTLDLGRLTANNVSIGPTVVTTGSTLQAGFGGSIVMDSTNVAGVSVTNSLLRAYGSVIFIDPITSQVLLNGVSTTGIGPAIPGSSPPPQPPPSGPIILANNQSTSTIFNIPTSSAGTVSNIPQLFPLSSEADSGGNSSTILNTDTISVPVGPLPVATPDVGSSMPEVIVLDGPSGVQAGGPKLAISSHFFRKAASKDTAVSAELPEEEGNVSKPGLNKSLLDSKPPTPLQQFVAAGPCQPYVLQSSDPNGNLCVTLVAGAGTVFSATGDGGEPAATRSEGQTRATSHTLALTQGKMVVVSGQKQGLTVRLAHGTVELPPATVGLIEQTPAGTTRLVSLSGGKATLLLANAKSPMSVNPGEELVTGDDSLEEEFVPADGIDRQVISASVTVISNGGDAISAGASKSTSSFRSTENVSSMGIKKLSVRVQKNSFNREQMKASEKLLICLTCARSGCSKQQCGKTREELDMPIKPAASGLPKSGPPLKPAVSGSARINPVAYYAPGATIKQETVDVRTLSSDSAIVKSTGSSVSFSGPDVLTCSAGDVLVRALKPVTVKTGECSVNVAAGAIVLMRIQNKVVSVANVWDTKGGSVAVHSPRGFTDVPVGEECVIGSKDLVPLRSVSGSYVARRQTHLVSIDPEHNMMMGDVSISSLISGNSLLKEMWKSATVIDQAIMTKLCKMSLVLSVTTGRRGPYSAVERQ